MYLIKENITFEKAFLELNKLLLSYIDHDNDCEGIYYLLVKLNDESKEILESLINNKEEYIEEFKSENNKELDITYLWSMIDVKFKEPIIYNSKENVFEIENEQEETFNKLLAKPIYNKSSKKWRINCTNSEGITEPIGCFKDESKIFFNYLEFDSEPDAVFYILNNNRLQLESEGQDEQRASKGND